MTEIDFYVAVGDTNFCDRYYALCARFPVRDMPLCQLSHRVTLQLLSDLGLTAKWDARDKSYSFDRILRTNLVHIGFSIQQSALVEFWFCLEQDGRTTGSNFAVIAYETAKMSGRKLPESTYPRPEFHSVEELRQILAECFELADDLTSIIERSS